MAADIRTSILDLDVKVTSNWFNEHGDEMPDPDLFHVLMSALKDKERESHTQRVRQMVYLLSLHGVDINSRDDSGNTPLQAYLELPAVDVGVVEAFLRCNADVYAPNKQGRTPFALAYFNPRLSKSLKSVFKQYVPGLWRAVESDDVMNVRKLVNQWCHTNIVKDGKTLTQQATETGSESVVRVVRDIKLSMDLAHAALAADVHVARKMLVSREKVNINFHNMGDNGATPLYYAILNNDMDMVDLLLDNGARADIPMSRGDNEIPLFMAVLTVNGIEEKTLSQVVERLTRNTISKIFFLGENVLLHCIENDVGVKVTNSILTKGGAALVTSRDQDNLTPRDVAELNQKMDYVQLIDEIIFDWVFHPKDDDSNRRLLCLHSYPHVPRIRDQTEEKQGDAFFDQLDDYWKHVQMFHAAVEEGDLDRVNELLYLEQFSVYLEPCMADSRTSDSAQPALFKAVLRGNRDLIHLLVEAFLFLLGQRLDFIRDQFHRTVLFYAIAKDGMEDIVKYLTENGASEHVMDKDGRSPQVFRDRKGHPVMEEFLHYHLSQDFTRAEPEPWAVPVPAPIIEFLKKRAEDHKHEHGLHSHQHGHGLAELDLKKHEQELRHLHQNVHGSVKLPAVLHTHSHVTKKTENNSPVEDFSEGSETESNQDLRQARAPGETSVEDNSSCYIL